MGLWDYKKKHETLVECKEGHVFFGGGARRKFETFDVSVLIYSYPTRTQFLAIKKNGHVSIWAMS